MCIKFSSSQVIWRAYSFVKVAPRLTFFSLPMSALPHCNISILDHGRAAGLTSFSAAKGQLIVRGSSADIFRSFKFHKKLM